MSVRRRSIIVSFAVAAAVSAVASAHDFWLRPESFRPRVDTPVAIDIMTGHGGTADVRPRDPKRIVKFVLAEPAGTRDVPGIDGRAPAGLVRPTVAGPHVVGYQSTHAVSELPPQKFESYLHEEGLERIVEDRATRGASGAVEREIYMRCAKSILVVEAEKSVTPPPRPDAEGGTRGSAEGGEPASGAPARGASGTANEPAPEARPLGLRLELVPLSLPTRMPVASEAPLRLQLLYEGKPIEGVRVALKEPVSGTSAAAERTSPDGTVALAIPKAGPWLVTAVHMVRAPEGIDAVWESMWASLTFSVDAERG